MVQFWLTLVLLIVGCTVSGLGRRHGHRPAGRRAGAAALPRWARRPAPAVAARLLGEQVEAPPPFRRATGSLIVRLDARLRDGPAWRAVGYILLKLPIMFGQYIALAFWVCGTIDLIYPLWWPLFRNAPGAACSRCSRDPGRRSAALVHATSWGGSLLVAVFGAACC